MNKTEMSEILSKRLGLNVSQVSKTINEFFELCKEVVNKGESVTIMNFASFKSRAGQKRIYMNPITKRYYYSQPRNHICVKLSKNFKFSIK